MAQTVGEPYVHLGMNMSALAIPDDPQGGSQEEVLIWFGIIDILQVCLVKSAR